MDMFIYKAEEYMSRRDFDMKHHYIQNMALGLSKLENIPFSEAKTFIENGINDGTIPFHDPEVRFLAKQPGGDRVKIRKSVTISQYLGRVKEQRLILSPTFTTYFHPKILPSELSSFTEENVSERSRMKKLELKYEQEKKEIEASMARNAQLAAKLNNNSLSGAFVSEYNPAYNRSAHSTLTSVCRTCASFANINNERFMMGYRHFFNVNVVIENILSVLSIMNYEDCGRIIEKYNLHIVTRQEFRDAIEYSTQYYFRGAKPWKKLDEFFATLSEFEMTIYLYTADFYHLRVFNEELVRGFFDRIINTDISVPSINPEETCKNIDEDMGMLGGILFMEELNYNGITSGDTRRSEKFPYLMGGIERVKQTISEWEDLIQVFWINDCLPHDTAEMPDMVRKCVLGGDTDSTLFTVLNWSEWYRGKVDNSPTSMKAAQTIIYFTSMMVRHYLAWVSAMIGIPRKYLFTMAMKNEFMFPIFMTTRRTKNYIATVCAREGVLYEEFEKEIKGPALKGNKTTLEIQKEITKMIDVICNESWEKQSISLREMIQRVAKIEYQVYDSICKGSTEYLSKADIKKKEVYAKPMSSNYMSYDLWENVFADKYGHINELPIMGVKVSIEAKSRAKCQAWVDSIQDRAIAAKLQRWLEVNDKKAGLSTIILPTDIVSQHGIPDEIRVAINFRKIIYGLTEAFYVMLESLLFYVVNDNITKLCLDNHPEMFDTLDRYISYLNNDIGDTSSEG